MAVIPTTFFDALIATQETTVSLVGGNFTGGSLKITRAGGVVTLSATGVTHASLSTVTSLVVLPSWAIPTSSRRNTFESTSSGPFHAVIDVNTNGTITLTYLNATLVATVRTNGGSNLTISYNI
jgi:hypothetical protein